MASTILNRTPSSTGNRKKWTLSMWIKNSNLKGQGGSSYQRLYQADNDNEYFRFTESTGKLLWLTNNGSSGGFLTTRVFRDTNAWYHLVLRIDTTLGTAGDRSRLYVNGVEETAFDTENQVAQDYDTYSNCISKVMQFGGYSTSDQNFNGCMSHVHMCDGYSYAPTEFGETDSTTGEWKIKTVPSVSYGTNGFFILKDGNSVTDQSGQGNNLTVSGTLTKTEDCPSNVFATWNPLEYHSTSTTFLDGNTSCNENTGTGWTTTGSTLGAVSGKYYAEFKYKNGNFCAFGVGRYPFTNSGHTQLIGEVTGSVGYRANGTVNIAGQSSQTFNTYTTGDIIGVALDLDNGNVYFSKNGTWENSGDPTSGSTGTGAINLPNYISTEHYFFVACPRNGEINANFGNGYLETTAISSEGTNASGIGKFEYDVPTGYTALCTKGLNE
jgi:hypothetical protein